MAFSSVSISHASTPLFYLISILLILSGTIDSTPTTNSDFFDSHISLYGDAAFADHGSTIRLTGPSISSSGMVIYLKPLTFLNSNPRNGVSFSAHFAFSISPENGDGIMFLIAPKDMALKFPGKDKFGLTETDRFFGIEFDTLVDGGYVGDSTGNHIGIDVSNLVSSSTVNVSSIDLVLNSGVKLQSWIDYDATSKRIEVRLSEFGTIRPYNPLLSYDVDLGQMWKDEEVFVGISASNGNSLQISNVYSCMFVVRDVLSSFHSQPLDPSSFKEADQKIKSDEVYEQKSSFFPLSILAGLIFTTGCGALVAFMVLFLWVVFVDRHRIPSEPDFKYENITVVVGNDNDDLKK